MDKETLMKQIKLAFDQELKKYQDELKQNNNGTWSYYLMGKYIGRASVYQEWMKYLETDKWPLS